MYKLKVTFRKSQKSITGRTRLNLKYIQFGVLYTNDKMFNVTFGNAGLQTT